MPAFDSRNLRFNVVGNAVSELTAEPKAYLGRCQQRREKEPTNDELTGSIKYAFVHALLRQKLDSF